MGRPRIWTDDAERKRAARAAGKVKPRAPKKAEPCSFLAVDGEGLGRTGYHLLAASDGEQIENLNGLSTEECLSWLLTQARKRNAKGKTRILVGYGLSYDINHWIHDLQEEQVSSLCETNKCKIKVNNLPYDLEVIQGKWLKLSFKNRKGFDIPVLEVYDVYPFFQSSFLAAIAHPKNKKNGWNCVSDEEWELLQWGKNLRGEFSTETWEEVKRYNLLECEVLVRMMNKLRAALQESGITLRSWHGPGAVANALLKQHQMEQKIGQKSEEVQDACLRAYFGGRFEVHSLGTHEKVYDYDISSAYPKATTLLPATTGVWSHVREWQGEHNWTVYRVCWRLTPMYQDRQLRPFPWRDKNGGVTYPYKGEGWYWAWEVREACAAFGKQITILEGWRLDPDEENAFAWMLDLAEKRVSAKHAAAAATTEEERDRLNAVQRSYKLALNSIYGKTVQSVGKHPYMDPMWAGLITSHCRARLMAEARKAPEGSLVCFATDGLFTTARLDGLESGEDLGAWELAAEGSLEIYQSGCYRFINYSTGIQTARFRGCPSDRIPWQKLEEEWRRNGPCGAVSIPVTNFIGYRTAIARNDLSLWCQWIDTEKRIDLHPGGGIVMPSQLADTIPWRTEGVTDTSVCSYPYRKLEKALEEPETPEDGLTDGESILP